MLLLFLKLHASDWIVFSGGFLCFSGSLGNLSHCGGGGGGDCHAFSLWNWIVLAVWYPLPYFKISALPQQPIILTCLYEIEQTWCMPSSAIFQYFSTIPQNCHVVSPLSVKLNTSGWMDSNARFRDVSTTSNKHDFCITSSNEVDNVWLDGLYCISALPQKPLILWLRLSRKLNESGWMLSSARFHHSSTASVT